MSGLWVKRWLAIGALLSGLSCGGYVSASNESEAALKAGFLFNFARYSEWQEDAALFEQFRLCSPDKVFAETAKQVLAQQTVHNLPILVRYLELDAAAVSQCNLLFISAPYQQQWQSLDKHLFAHMMLVGESPRFIHYGGHIRFFLLSGKVRFEVAPDALKQAGIVMSSKVLRLSRVVKGSRP